MHQDIEHLLAGQGEPLALCSLVLAFQKAMKVLLQLSWLAARERGKKVEVFPVSGLELGAIGRRANLL